MALFSGQGLKGKAINVEIGVDGNGGARVRWDMEIVDGEHKGKVAKYSGKLNPDNVKWTMRDMKTIGWKGEKSATFVDDVKKANLVVEFDAEIAEYNGSKWTSVRFGGAAPLGQLDNDKQRELDKLFMQQADEASAAGDNSDLPF